MDADGIGADRHGVLGAGQQFLGVRVLGVAGAAIQVYDQGQVRQVLGRQEARPALVHHDGVTAMAGHVADDAAQFERAGHRAVGQGMVQRNHQATTRDPIDQSTHSQRFSRHRE